MQLHAEMQAAVAAAKGEASLRVSSLLQQLEAAGVEKEDVEGKDKLRDGGNKERKDKNE